MYLISLESCDIDLSNGICYMLVAILHPEVQHDQCKPTKHLNSFDTHCTPHIYCASYADHNHRNICMCHWKRAQPNRQGLLQDFDTHFKLLSDLDKEVCMPRVTLSPSVCLT